MTNEKAIVAKIVCCPGGDCILATTDEGCIALDPKYGNTETADKILAALAAHGGDNG